jgi:hypothetical protein
MAPRVAVPTRAATVSTSAIPGADAASSVVTPTVTLAAALSTPLTDTIPAPVQGTIIANRTQALVRYFAEGETFALEPLRSTGLSLLRPTAVLNLYNCDAAAADQVGCFWDPYLLQRDGFYEIVAGEDAGAPTTLTLRAAGAPPADQIWIQNRVGRSEQIYFGDQMHDLPAATVSEFTLKPGEEGPFYLRSCILSDREPVCEWSAHKAEPGAWYALVEETWRSALPGASVSNLELQPILGMQSAPADVAAPAATADAGAAATVGSAALASSPAAAVPTATPQPVFLTCQLAVPALNVRSGPGLEYEIVQKVRSTEIEVASVMVAARTENGEWLLLDERSADNGWVISGDSYLTCDGDTLSLPVADASKLPPTPTPLPVVEAAPIPEVPVEAAPVEASPVEATPGETAPVEATAPLTPTVDTAPAMPAVAKGLALVVIHNGFDQDMRVTIDQRFRVEPGPSEIDLKPGDSASLLVYPGQIGFSASSPWNQLSGMSDLYIDPDQTRDVWLLFVPDPGEPGEWLLQY